MDAVDGCTTKKNKREKSIKIKTKKDENLRQSMDKDNVLGKIFHCRSLQYFQWLNLVLEKLWLQHLSHSKCHEKLPQNILETKNISIKNLRQKFINITLFIFTLSKLKLDNITNISHNKASTVIYIYIYIATNRNSKIINPQHNFNSLTLCQVGVYSSP